MQSISSSVHDFLAYGVESKVVNKNFISLIYGTNVMSSTRNRKHESGAEKHGKKQRLEAFAQSQKCALDRFVVSVRETPETNVGDGQSHRDDAVEVETPTTEFAENPEANVDQGHNNTGEEERDGDGNGDGDNEANTEPPEANFGDGVDNSFHPDIFDPRTWNALDPKAINILLEKGPKRDLSIEHGPRDKFSRRFSALSYTRVLSNREKCDREWLVYSKELDKVFCFCCKLLKKGTVKGQLANEGFNDWAHLSHRLTENESSREHVANMSSWYDFRLRLEKNQTIDNVAQRELEKEREHWRKVLLRILLIVKFLAEHNIAFRGSNSKLYQDNNGNFLGLVQMLAEFDPVTKEHVDRITAEKIRDHYLGPSIQNELINLLASAIRSAIVGKVKEAKYFSVILDCTPDASHQEQMSLIIWYVDTYSDSVCIKESFLGFLAVNDTTGQGLFDVILEELKSLDLEFLM
jgi:hypothetical protein